MKLNSFQKILLVIYGIFFIYFAILHVPFKASYGHEIEYDTLFSTKSNLDIPRLALIVAVITVLSATLFALLKNVRLAINLKSVSKRTYKTAAYCAAALALISVALVIYLNISGTHSQSSAARPATDSTSAVSVDSLIVKKAPYEIQKEKTCTSEEALINFKSYMKFNYPDWKIFGTPVVQEQSDCTYRVQFTTENPHLAQFGDTEKEVMVAEISYNFDYTKYSFTIIRGTLY